MDNKVDILLATYQGASYIKEQLQSILDQTYPHFNILMRDDGSKDQTIPIAESFQQTYPDRIKILPSHTRLGVRGNFSQLMSESTADYIMFSDQDDYWLPKKIEMSLNKIKAMENRYGKQTPLLVHTDLQVVRTDLSVINPSFWNYSKLNPLLDDLNRLLVQNVVTGCTMIINRKLLELAYPVPDQVMMHDWWIALVAAAFGHIDCITEPTMLYRQHGHNDTGAKQHTIWKYVQRRFSKKYVNTTPNNYRQAELFLDRYQSFVQPHQRELLQAYCSLKNLSFLERKRTILRYKFFKQGLLRNLHFIWS